MESKPESSELSKCTGTKRLLRLRSYRLVFKNVAEAGISTIDKQANELSESACADVAASIP